MSDAVVGKTGFRRVLRVGVAATAIAVTAAACSSTAAQTDPGAPASARSSPAGGKTVIAYVPGVSPFPYFDTACRGAKAAAAHYGYTIDYVGVSAYDATTQTSALNAELAARPGFLLVSPVDQVANRPAVQRYIDAGIPVITVGGTLSDTNGIISQIATDNYQGGVIAAQYLGKELGDSGTIATLDIAAGQATVNIRVSAFAATIKKEFPGITVLPVQYGGGTISGNEQLTRSILLAHPDIKAIFGATETNGEGAAAAIKALGKTGQIKVTAFDASPEEVAALKAGELDFLSVSQPALELKLAVQQAHDYLTGDKAAIKPYTLVPNVGITQQNVDDPAIKQYLYTSGC
jgi:ribose transport system substrate-binding protein